MNTRDIEKILASDIFVRRAGVCKVLPRDKLPLFIDRTKTACLVVNTDPSNRPGSHWVSLYKNAHGTWEYFDSYGLPVRHREIDDFIKRNSERPYIYNPRMLQHLISNACGLYAVYFLLIKARGGSMQSVLRPFSTTQQWRNDRLVYKLVKKLVNKKTSSDLLEFRQ